MLMLLLPYKPTLPSLLCLALRHSAWLFMEVQLLRAGAQVCSTLLLETQSEFGA
jgi:hypothetical protein